MKKEEFYYDSRDGKRNLHAIQYLPDNPEDVRCVVQIVHGMAEYFERFELVYAEKYEADLSTMKKYQKKILKRKRRRDPEVLYE